MPTPDPRLLAAIRQQPRYLQVPLLTTAMIESGGRLDAVGDGGRSFGPYQMYDLGRGAGVPKAKRMDPVFSTQSAASEFQTFYDRGARGGDLAFRAQRPADRGGYLSRYAQFEPQAQRLLGSSSAGTPPAPGRPAGGPSSPAAAGGRQLTPGSIEEIRRYAATSRADVLAGRNPAGVETVLPKLKYGPGKAAVDVVANEFAGAPAAPAANQVVRAAMDFGPGGKFDPNPNDKVGVDYSWGGGGMGGPTKGVAQGSNIVGIDCSGLTEYAWAKKGVKIGPTTYQQIKAGRAIGSVRDVQPGDLLFPSTGHVQLAAGGGMVWEAPQTGGHVQKVAMRPSYIAIRRPQG